MADTSAAIDGGAAQRMTCTRNEARVASLRVTQARGTTDVLAGVVAAEASGGGAAGFQSRAWLAALFDEVVVGANTEPRLVNLHEAANGALVLAVPLVVRRVGRLRIAEIVDLGLADYGTALVGPSCPGDAASARDIYRAICSALDDVDLIRFEKMPAQVAGRTNPLAVHPRAHPSRFNGNVLAVPDTVEAFVASRGKKYRKEAERARRRLEDMGEVRFARASTPSEIDRAYRQLETWQAERHLAAGHSYILDRPEVSRFYRRLLDDAAASGSGAASLYTLSAGEELVAVLLGITHGGTFTLVRIADGGEKWRHTSPGRMIVLDAMREERAHGITTFDLGIGDYPFKRWIGCQSVPLVDVTFARSWSALPRAWVSRAKQRLRSNQQARAIVQRIKGLRPKPEASD